MHILSLHQYFLVMKMDGVNQVKPCFPPFQRLFFLTGSVPLSIAFLYI